MDRFRKSFSIRKKRTPDTNESAKPQQWIEDERKIKEGSCSFQVKYLGCIEVFESRGMPVCEEAIKALRKSKKKTQRAILYVSGDALRVSDEISKHLIVDQTIEKVSFCAPDRDHDKGFAYICRDGATRRWMCYAFLALKESGERLSHAVGCAFAICLEKKQKREREAVQTVYPSDDTSFVRISSFRPATLRERLMDPQSAIIVDQQQLQPQHSENGSGGAVKEIIRSARSSEEAASCIVPFVQPSAMSPNNLSHPYSPTNPGAIPRPRASSTLLERQTSLRLFPKLQQTSPFKQSPMLRAANANSALQQMNRKMTGEPIPEETSDDFDPSSEFSQPALTPLSSHSVGSNSNPLGMFKDSSPGNGSERAVNGDNDQMFVKTLADPFSAAPFNPETIQQHHAQQLLQTQQLQANQFAAEFPPPPRNNVSPQALPAVDGFADWSLAVQQRIASPATQPQQPQVEVPPSSNTLSFGMSLFGVTPDPEPAPKTSPFTEPQWRSQTNWASVQPVILPPEPTSFADPFDIGWADRATAIVSGQLANSLQPHSSDRPPAASNNPFLTSQTVSGIM